MEGLEAVRFDALPLWDVFRFDFLLSVSSRSCLRLKNCGSAARIDFSRPSNEKSSQFFNIVRACSNCSSCQVVQAYKDFI